MNWILIARNLMNGQGLDIRKGYKAHSVLNKIFLQKYREFVGWHTKSIK